MEFFCEKKGKMLLCENIGKGTKVKVDKIETSGKVKATVRLDNGKDTLLNFDNVKDLNIKSEKVAGRSVKILELK